ncbi:hypothetical protein GYMLUDRAFT_242397 [Collybiopsis luxurians FD-317 M1]|uniref:Retrotransposon gag domain-containing protein n=1 Tax=Collybiopsis luxurians FD-317 M1 TaxID=944289 RepID=A0A0D0C3N2_9AGAR|nr:hypothetical protein GYMLUDRAFT_242397 [Collybiopsis luxurians FD-317 M1]
MPAHNEHNASKWDSKNEDWLLTFFKDFKIAADTAGISNDNAKMKTFSLHYINLGAHHFWKTLPSFNDNAKIWEAFKKEVIGNYPDAKENPDYTVKDLKKVITKFSKSGILSLKDMASYHHAFNTISHSLLAESILASVQANELYISVFSKTFWHDLNVQLHLDHGKKLKGKQYMQTQVKKTVDKMLTNLTHSSTSSNFNSGDLAAIPNSNAAHTIKIELSSDSFSKVTALLKKLLEVQESSRGPLNSISLSSNSTSSDKGKVEFDSSSFIVLKGGKKLPEDNKYTKGLIKKQFKCYYNDNPSEKTWILKLPPPLPTLRPELAGIDVSCHTSYILNGLQGPEMATKTYALINEVNDVNNIDDPNNVKGRKDEPVKTLDPKLSQPIPSSPTPTSKPPKPVIGKLPPNYVPPGEQMLGAPTKDDTRNYHFWAPIETEAAIE